MGIESFQTGAINVDGQDLKKHQLEEFGQSYANGISRSIFRL